MKGYTLPSHYDTVPLGLQITFLTLFTVALPLTTRKPFAHGAEHVMFLRMSLHCLRFVCTRACHVVPGCQEGWVFFVKALIGRSHSDTYLQQTLAEFCVQPS